MALARLKYMASCAFVYAWEIDEILAMVFSDTLYSVRLWVSSCVEIPALLCLCFLLLENTIDHHALLTNRAAIILGFSWLIIALSLYFFGPFISLHRSSAQAP